VSLFRETYRKCRNYTFETVLITTEGAHTALQHRGFFDHVVTFDDLFDEKHWP